MSKRLLRAEEVSLLVGVSIPTLNNWYRFKRENPDDGIAKILPDYIKESEKSVRYWQQEDIWQLMDFKKKIVTGRNGFMGSVTQRYKPKEDKKNGKKKDSNRNGKHKEE